jgi:hypothetical protein
MPRRRAQWGYCIDNPAIAREARRQGKTLPPPSMEWSYR